MAIKLVLDTSNDNPASLVQVRDSKSVALICKATEGDNFKDPTLGTHRTIATKLKIPFGSYLFIHPDSTGDEALFYLTYAKPRKGNIQPIIDAEVTDGESYLKVADRVESCAKVLESKGYNPILYSSSSFWQRLYKERPQLKRLRVWEADYPGRFTRWFPYLAKRRIKLMHGATVVMWQWTDSYLVDGKKFDASNLLTKLSNLLI